MLGWAPLVCSLDGGRALVSGTAEKATRIADEPGLAKQNGTTIRRVFGTGNIVHAEEQSDGTMHATIRINEDELILDPGILILPHGGTLNLDVYNDDKNTHCAVFPSNGHHQFIWM